MINQKLQAVFYYDGELYIHKNNQKEIFYYMVKTKTGLDDILKKKIYDEFSVDSQIKFKFSNEIISDIHTYLVQLNTLDHEKFEKVTESILDSVKKHSRIYLMQSVIEMDLRHIRNKLSNSVQEFIKITKISDLEQEYYKKTKILYSKNGIDSKSEDMPKVLIGSIVLAALFQYMFLWEYLGVSVTIYTILFSGAVIGINKDKLIHRGKEFYFFLISSWIFSAMFMFFSNYLLNALNFLIIILFFNAAILVGKYNYEIDEKLLKKSVMNIFGGLANIFRLLKLIKSKAKRKRIDKVKNENRKHILSGILILLLLLVVILPLLMSADDIFNDILTNVFTNFDFNVDHVVFKRSILFVLIFIYNISYIWSVKYDVEYIDKKRNIKRSIKFETMIIILVGLNIVYGMFLLIQMQYLFGGSHSGLPQGMIYSQYARKGFFELVIITMINISVIIIGNLKIEEFAPKLMKYIKSGFSLIIIFTYGILISAFYRMILYIEEFGYTRLRVMVQFTIIVLAVFLFMIIIYIWKESWKIKRNTLIFVTIMYLGFNLFNMDGFIIRGNIERYNNGKEIDLKYFDDLGWDGMRVLYKMQKDDEIDYRAYKDKIEIDNIIWDFVERKSTYDGKNFEYTNRKKAYDKWFEYCIGKNFIKKY